MLTLEAQPPIRLPEEERIRRAKLIIRPGRVTDAGNLVRLLTEAYTDQGGVYPAIEPGHLLNWVTEVLTKGYALVAEKSKRVVGSVGLSNYSFPWSPEPFIHMDWFYVQRKFRQGGTTDGLLRALHAFADEKGAPLVGGIQSAKDASIKDRMMKIKGWTYMGGHFIRYPPTSPEA